MSVFNVRATSAGAGDSPRELPAAGTYKAVLCGLFDVGTQEGGQYEPKHQVVLLFQLFKGNKPAVDSAGNRLTISQFCTLSMNEKSKLRAVAEALAGPIVNGSEFYVGDLLGRPCRLQVERYTKQNGQPGAKIKAVVSLDSDEVAPKPDVPAVGFEIANTRCDIPDSVPGWVAAIVRKSPEWQGAPEPSRATQPAEDGEDDIPF